MWMVEKNTTEGLESRYDHARSAIRGNKRTSQRKHKKDTDSNMHELETLPTIIEKDLKDIRSGLSASKKTMLKTKAPSCGNGPNSKLLCYYICAIIGVSNGF